MSNTRKIIGPEKKEAPKAKPVASLADKSLTEQRRGKGSRTLGAYVAYLDDLRSYCQSWDDMFVSNPGSPPREPAKGPVLEAIKSADTSDQDVMKALFEIADRAEDKEVRAEAQRAILRKVGSAFTGIRPPA